MTSAQVEISSFDWGAHGALEIVAELDNGNRVTATVPGTGEASLAIPRRSPGKNVALKWASDRGVEQLADESDDENDPPGDGFRGDGFTQYEEYRGFMEGGKWTSADPQKKDVFVLNLLRSEPNVQAGVKLYEAITKLAVHSKLVETEIHLDHVINFNHSQGPHLVDQHVIYVREGGEEDENGFTVSQVDEVGTPGTAHAVNLYINRYPGGTIGYTQASTVAHEMLHSSNVYHHGERDTEVAWHVSVDSDGKTHITEHGGGLVADASTTVATVASWIGLGEVDVRTEDGYPISAKDFPKDKIVWLGQLHGQHSGNYDCVMKYDCVTAYPSEKEPDVRYLAIPEPRPRGLCTDSEGTGFNTTSHKPQSRFGPAAMTAGSGVKLPRGDCAHQIRVNDMGEEPKR